MRKMMMKFEGGEANEPKQAKFGVDIYDPLNEFEHIRSVELWEPRVVDKKDAKTKQKAVMTLKRLWVKLPFPQMELSS